MIVLRTCICLYSTYTLTARVELPNQRPEMEQELETFGLLCLQLIIFVDVFEEKKA